MDWFKTAFGSHYLEVYGHRDENDARRAVDFLERRAGALRGWALDLCCGAGRHSLEWVRRRRNGIVGFDLSERLLSDARRACAKEGLRFPLVRGDMRRLPFADGAFSLVLNLFTSFGYFDSDAENERVFAEAARVLAPGTTRFVFDHINPSRLRRRLEPETRRTTDGGFDVLETRRIDEKRRRVIKGIEVLRGETDPGAPRKWVESVRFYERAEVESMARRCGLALEDACGDYDGSSLEEDSPRAIYVFRKSGRERSNIDATDTSRIPQ